MRDHLQKANELRACTEPHYNCCQATLIPFCDVCGIDEETAFRLASHFGSGMHCGSVCGALSGALMVLGLAGADLSKSEAFLRAFREENGCLNCPDLLKRAREAGEERKTHCDRMVLQAVEQLDKLLAQ